MNQLIEPQSGSRSPPDLALKRAPASLYLALDSEFIQQHVQKRTSLVSFSLLFSSPLFTLFTHPPSNVLWHRSLLCVPQTRRKQYLLRFVPFTNNRHVRQQPLGRKQHLCQGHPYRRDKTDSGRGNLGLAHGYRYMGMGGKYRS